MTTKINNEHKKLNVPNLRFPEFQGEWTTSLLSDYLTENKERNKKGEFDKTDVLSVSGDYGIVNQIELLGRSFAGASVLPYHVVRHGNIVYTKSPLKEYPYGIVKANTGVDGIVSTLYAVYNIKNNVDAQFIEYYFSSANRTNRYFKPIVRIGAKHDMKIGNQEVLANKVTFPNLEEQIKIASLFRFLDERIATQNKIIDKLQSLIKGIMVELQKQGIDRGTWKKISLGDVLSERNERNTNLYQVFSVSVSQGIVNQVDYLGRSFAAKDTSKYNVVHYGDLVYTKSPTGSFPYGIVKQSRNIENVAVSPLYGVFEPRSLAVGTYLHEYFMSEINTHNYLHPLIQKGAKNTINITNQRFLENRVPMPVNSNELLLISKLLYSLNDKIKHVQNTLQEYHKQKQYLLRQMFI